EEPVVEEPAVEEPAVEEPAVEEPVVEEPVVEEPVVEEPAVEEPVAEEPAVEEPAVEEPAVEEPVVEEPAVEEPVAEEPVVEEPVNPYPHLSANKINSILRQIDYMLETTHTEDMELTHRIVFGSKEAEDEFAAAMSEEGFAPAKDAHNPAMLLLSKATNFTRDELAGVILRLADKAAEANGMYRGWSVKVVE
ncbi:MAG: hypothetical protein IIY75_03320, partial [Erysipelotrichales bacterium]|nr:hypothetical protein [Erysipelotrichales bacterium]